MKERLEQLAALAARRPLATVAIVAALALAGGLLALGLAPSTGTDTFVSASSPSFRATAADHRNFGGDPVVVLIREPLPDLVETKDLATVSELEACLAGQVLVASQALQSLQPAPAGSLAAYGGRTSPCGALMRTRPVQVVYGPGTFLNRAVAAVNTQVLALESSAQAAVANAQRAADQLALARGLSRKQAIQAANGAGQLERQQQTQQLAALYLDSGITGLPRIDDPQFIPQIVFDQSRGVNQPKARFAYLFPTAGSALIQVRLKGGLSDAEQASAIALVRQAVNMPMFRLAYGGTYTVTGAPVVTADLAAQVTGSIAGLLIAALVVMAVTLLVVFRRRLRMLPLAIALAAAGITFGATRLVGATLTMASIAVLPILIGLAVDYAIQFLSRAQEGETGAGTGPDRARAAVAAAAASGAPTIAVAALATATGFLVLLLSPVPMVRGFGLLLVVGIAVALICALTAGSAAMVLADRLGHRDREPTAPQGGAVSLRGRMAGSIGASVRGAAEILHEAVLRLPRPPSIFRSPSGVHPIDRGHPGRLERVIAGVAQRPSRVLVLGALLAVLGWAADTQTSVQSDVTKLVPSSMPALRHLRELERVTGVSGEIDVTIHAASVATPATIGWMMRYENALLKHFGYLESRGCSQSTLCPALSLPDLFSGGTPAGTAAAGSLTASSIDSLLSAVPSYFSQAVITRDRRNATLAFGIRLMPLVRQQQVIDYMRSQLHPPSGVTAQLAGIPVLAAEANMALASSSRRLLTLLAGLIAVGVVLLAVFRDPERALVPLMPIVLATGWSALVLFLIGIPLNPMSATLGALVIAISTEFSVLLAERFRQERAAGAEVTEALSLTYRSTGRAVLASGITAIAGFGVLIFSSITMLRDFGFVTLIDLSVSLLGVLICLPAVLAVSEREGLLERVRGLASRMFTARPRTRRRTRVA
ncbi:MAG: efflux RND transporter permease subunit [Solirubrobacteraceae bacterium]